MHVRSLLAGVGLATAVAVGSLAAVAAASADPGGGSASTQTPSSSSGSCPRVQVRAEVRDYLAAHPDVWQELQKIRSLPQDQRAAERKSYLAAHPDVAPQLKAFAADRRSARWEAAGDGAAILAAHPGLSDLFTAVGQAPAGQRQAAARAYLQQHPTVRDELQQVRKQMRQQCTAGR